MEPGGFALLGGDASVDSGLTEGNSCSTSLGTGLNFREKKLCCLCLIFDQNRTSFGSIGTRLWP